MRRWKSWVLSLAVITAGAGAPTPAPAATLGPCKWKEPVGLDEPVPIKYANIDLDDGPVGSSYVATAESGINTWNNMVGTWATFVDSPQSESDFNIDSTYFGWDYYGTWTAPCYSGYYKWKGGANNTNRLRLNQNLLNKEYEKFMAHHVLAIVNHELGHSLGLEHFDVGGEMPRRCTYAIMYTYPSSCWDTNQTPTQDDQLGVKYQYPNRADGCLTCAIKP